ncbi:MAG: DNA-directed RNA polymerase subunit D [Desulfurococcales archaeon]|nr:DNA-directed RNA polymerase subunit D [Desulfurococcales archaeon]
MNRDSKRSVNVVKYSDKEIQLLFTEYPVVLVNALRRLSLSDVPSLAVDFVYVYDNSSSVFDEILAHRLGMLVFESDEALDKLGSPEACKDSNEEDEKCYVKLVLNTGVDEGEKQGRFVTASEISVNSNFTRILYPETPLLYLIPGQRVHVVAYARLGRGKEHAKWSPASAATLQYMPRISFNGKKASEKCLKCLEAYPEVVEKLKEGGEGTIEIMENINTSGLVYCADTDCSGAIEVEYDESRLILTIESTGALKPERIVLESVKALEARARRLIERLEEVEGEAS